MCSVLAFVFAMGQTFATPSEAGDHLMLTACGALFYAVYALLVGWILDDRGRRLLLAEAMHAFAAYLRAKAAVYNPDTTGPAAFHALIDAHATLADRLQVARDYLFARRSHRIQLKRIDTLIALLDAFETVLSSDADLEILRAAAQSNQVGRELMWRLNQLVNEMADDVERLTLALRTRRGHAAPHPHAEDVQQLLAALEEARATDPHDPALPALASTINKLVLADSYIATLAVALSEIAP